MAQVILDSLSLESTSRRSRRTGTVERWRVLTAVSHKAMPESREWSAICNLKDTTNPYNEIISYFYPSYALFEIPCNLLCKHGWFLPIATVLFGVASLATAYVILPL